jgi:hypothetical protein
MRTLISSVVILGVIAGAAGQIAPGKKKPVQVKPPVVTQPPVGAPTLSIGTVVKMPPLTVGTTSGTVGIVVPIPTGVPVAPPLTTQEVAVIRTRLQTYVAAMQKNDARTADFRSDGHSVESDAVERAAKTPSGDLSPHYMERLRQLPGKRPAGVDPGLTSATRSALRARLGREPSSAELAAELNAFDARIAEMNRALAGKRVEIAKAVKRDGVMPRGLEATMLQLPPADPQTNSPAAQEGMRALMQMLLTR